MKYLQRSWALPNDSKHSEASLSAVLTDIVFIVFTSHSEAYISRSGDFYANDTRQRQTKPITLPLAHARGVIITSIAPNLFFDHTVLMYRLLTDNIVPVLLLKM